MVVNWVRVELTLDEPSVKRRKRRVCFLAVKRREEQMVTP